MSESPWKPSGYGMVTREVCGRLSGAGHTVEVVSRQHTSPARFAGTVPVWPVGRDPYGADVLPEHLSRMRPDVLVTLGDVHHFGYLAEPEFQDLLAELGVRWLVYYPVDAERPLGGLPDAWTSVLGAADGRLTMSRFGQEVSRRSGLDAQWVPHGVDTAVFAPPTDRRGAKERLGYQDSFVILSDARNQPRKMLPRSLEIAAAFIEAHPATVLHLHCDPEDPSARTASYGYDIRADVRALGLASHVRFTDSFRMGPGGGIPVGDVAALYAAADVHLLCSHSEGFGLPSLQAAAAGVVPISVAGSASWELTEGHGFPVPAQWIVTDGAGLRRHLISRDATLAVLDRLYHDPEELHRRSHRARRFALGYSWDEVMKEWQRCLLPAGPVRSAAPLRSPGASDANRSDERPPQGGCGRGAEQNLTAPDLDAFTPHTQLTIPVRLPAAICGDGTDTSDVVLATPGSEALAGALSEIFPGIRPLPADAAGPDDEDAYDSDDADLGRLLRQVLRSVLVVDARGTGPQNTDLVCAVLGVPYYGRTRWWPSCGSGSELLRVRGLLTDHGLSAWRRDQAHRAVMNDRGARAAVLRVLRRRATGQPDGLPRP
ncbi:glycosyltransferase family 4 protein [Streptomyces canus]|uniref:glycosyltransferase family 4 protein n=1 Tax=Streptomyces canus TaxID=58343 RepID=UPI00371F6E2F